MPIPSDQQLIDAAIAASQHAYMPYSNYRVGAALLAASGAVYGGCNIESVSFTPTVCAERTAVFKAVSEGERAVQRHCRGHARRGLALWRLPPDDVRVRA